jgi:hypothetical protein
LTVGDRDGGGRLTPGRWALTEYDRFGAPRSSNGAPIFWFSASGMDIRAIARNASASV